MTLGETLQLVGIVGGAGILTKILAVLVQTRDTVRDHIRDVGTKNPPSGLFLKIHNLEGDVDWHSRALSKLSFDRRQFERRREDE